MTGDNMKSGVVDSDRIKFEGRHSVHRRKMPKNALLVNGGGGADDSGDYGDDTLVIHQVNLAAAFHDHISCTKSADLCRMPDTKESRVNLPCETDHIYANCSDKLSKSHGSVALTSPCSKERNEEKKQLQEMCLLQLELIKHLEEDTLAKDKQIHALKKEVEALKARQERMERRFSLMRRNVKSENNADTSGVAENDVSNVQTLSQPAATTPADSTSYPTTHAAMHLVTRYFGRRSKTIPSRALKRRYFGPPKALPCKKATVESTSSVTAEQEQPQQSLEKSKVDDNDEKPRTVHSTDKSMDSLSVTSAEEPKKSSRKRNRTSKVIPKLEDFLTTNKEYYLPVCYDIEHPFDETEIIDVPSWRYRPVSSFYQMEGTENIDDKVFQRRHLRCEQDEKRRKRWDMQRLREQQASDKLKFKQSGNSDKNSGNTILQKKTESFYPNPNKFEFVEVTERLPVLAFGQPIPLFQPSEFSLPWKVKEFHEDEKSKKNSARVT